MNTVKKNIEIKAIFDDGSTAAGSLLGLKKDMTNERLLEWAQEFYAFDGKQIKTLFRDGDVIYPAEKEIELKTIYTNGDAQEYTIGLNPDVQPDDLTNDELIGIAKNIVPTRRQEIDKVFRDGVLIYSASEGTV